MFPYFKKNQNIFRELHRTETSKCSNHTLVPQGKQFSHHRLKQMFAGLTLHWAEFLYK